MDFLEKSGMEDDAYNSALVKYLNPSIDVKNINKDYTYIVPMFSPNNAGVKFRGSNWIDIIEPHLNLKRTFDAINDAKIHISKIDRYENEINSMNSLNVTMKDLNFINHKDPNYVFESGIIYWYSMDLLNSVKDELNHSSAEWEGINTKVELVSKAVNLVRSGYLAPKTRVTVYTKNSHNYGKVHNLIVYFLDDFNYRLGRIDRCKKAFMTRSYEALQTLPRATWWVWAETEKGERVSVISKIDLVHSGGEYEFKKEIFVNYGN